MTNQTFRRDLDAASGYQGAAGPRADGRMGAAGSGCSRDPSRRPVALASKDRGTRSSAGESWTRLPKPAGLHELERTVY
jgi:hypothetical protein